MKIVLSLILPLLMLGGCSMEAESDGSLVVAAAASVRALVEEVADEYSAAHGVRIHVTSGATGELARQVREGAQIDVYFGADMATAQSLHGDGFADGDPVVYAVGELVLWQHPEAQPRINTLADVNEREVTVAIANPEMAPYGSAARAILRREGLWEANVNRVVQTNNVEQAFQFANSRNVTAAFVSRSLITSGASFISLDGPEARVRHGAIVVRHRDEPNPHARGFLDHLVSRDIEPILRKHGFDSPERQSAANNSSVGGP